MIQVLTYNWKRHFFVQLDIFFVTKFIHKKNFILTRIRTGEAVLIRTFTHIFFFLVYIDSEEPQGESKSFSDPDPYRRFRIRIRKIVRVTTLTSRLPIRQNSVVSEPYGLSVHFLSSFFPDSFLNDISRKWYHYRMHCLRSTTFLSTIIFISVFFLFIIH